MAKRIDPRDILARFWFKTTSRYKVLQAHDYDLESGHKHTVNYLADFAACVFKNTKALV